MSTAMKAASIGAAMAFMMMIFILLFRIRLPLVVWVLWPTRVLMRETRGTGGFWALLFQTVSFFSNALLYGAVGYGIGRLIEGNAHEG